MFALTSGELPLTAAQRTALIDAINGGKGFIGIHSATDTLYEFPDYGRLVGAYFKEHPWTQQGRVIVEEPSHPAAGVRDAFTLEEEFYTFRENPRGRVQVLMRLDAASVGAIGRLSAGVGAIVRQRPRLLQRARPFPGDLARFAFSGPVDRRDPLDRRPIAYEPRRLTVAGLCDLRDLRVSRL